MSLYSMSLSHFFETPHALVAHLQKKPPSGTNGFLTGEFDLFQAAHHIPLHAAKTRCDFLIVGLFADAFMQNKYGKHRPLCQFQERAEMLLGTRHVDAVVCLSGGVDNFLKIFKPDKFLKFTSPQMETSHCRTAFVQTPSGNSDDVPVEHIEVPVGEVNATEYAFSRIAEKLQISYPSIIQSEEFSPYLDETIPMPILVPEELSAFVDEQHELQEFLITTNGSFDILHLGHLRYLQQAKAWGGVLLVLVNDDQSIMAQKGPQRPIFKQQERMQALAALRCVDYVVPFSGETPLSSLTQIKPQLHIKGGSFEKKRIAEEKKLVESYGGHFQSFDLIGNYSSTKLLKRFIRLYNCSKTR